MFRDHYITQFYWLGVGPYGLKADIWSPDGASGDRTAAMRTKLPLANENGLLWIVHPAVNVRANLRQRELAEHAAGNMVNNRAGVF